MKPVINTSHALVHFTRTDVRMAELLKAALASQTPIILPAPKRPDEYFSAIVRSIVSQQISVKAAASVFLRLQERVGVITPENILRVPEQELRACGLSGQKTKYITHNAAIWHEISIHTFSKMTDEEVITELTKLYGIGRWTAEMFLMFSLARPDVFSYGDLGLMQGLFANYPLKKHWRKKISATVNNWSPHRTIASLVLWNQKDAVPFVM